MYRPVYGSEAAADAAEYGSPLPGYVQDSPYDLPRAPSHYQQPPQVPTQQQEQHKAAQQQQQQQQQQQLFALVPNERAPRGPLFTAPARVQRGMYFVALLMMCLMCFMTFQMSQDEMVWEQFSWLFIGETVFIGLMYLIAFTTKPRSFEVWDDKIVLRGCCYRRVIRFEDVTRVEAVSSLFCRARCCITNCATSMTGAIEVRSKRCCQSVVFTPENYELFMERFQAAYTSYTSPVHAVPVVAVAMPQLNSKTYSV